MTWRISQSRLEQGAPWWDDDYSFYVAAIGYTNVQSQSLATSTQESASMAVTVLVCEPSAEQNIKKY